MTIASIRRGITSFVERTAERLAASPREFVVFCSALIVGVLILSYFVAHAVRVWHEDLAHIERSEPMMARAAPARSVALTAGQKATADVVVEAATLKPLPEVFHAPGEVQVNDYVTSNVSTRVAAIVIARHAKLGDRVQKGQVLVTLFSADVAEAQSAFVTADKNHRRMRQLAQFVARKDLDEAEIKHQETRGRLETYGLSAAEIAALTAHGLGARPAGQFDLSAPQNGVVTIDDFRQGEVVEASKKLFEITNLSELWVEAHVSPALAPRVVGERAIIYTHGRSYEAHVVQLRETLDATTRTIGVRIQLDNTDGSLKPGEFVDVDLFGAPKPEIVVPTGAVLRDDDGDWRVYVETTRGAYQPKKVKVLHSVGTNTAISGIAPGTRVVTSGAFFIKSEAERSGPGEDD